MVSKTRAVEIKHGRPATRSGAATVQAASSTLRTLTSEVITPGQRFGHIGLRYRLDNAASPPSMEVRTTPDGHTWSGWLTVREEEDMYDEATGAHYVSPQYIGNGLSAQYRLLSSNSVDTLASFDLVFIDARGLSISPAARLGQDIVQAAHTFIASLLPRAYAATPARILSRAAWGADEDIMNWTPSYAPWRKAIVHHTVTAGTYGSSAEELRAIYYFHAVTRGWGDIGYNYLVDRFGNIWEGRAGGADVIGGHAYGWNSGTFGVAAMGDFSNLTPPASQQQGIADVIALQFAQRGIVPYGESLFTHQERGADGSWSDVRAVTSNIIGHRDASYITGDSDGQTACPGQSLYLQLDSIRTLAQRAFTSGYPQLVEYTGGASATLGTSRTSSVTMMLRNRGTQSIGSEYSLSYRLRRPGGAWLTYTAPRIPLGTALLPGASRTLTLTFTAPPDAGEFLIGWDMYSSSGWLSERSGTLLREEWINITDFDVRWSSTVMPTRFDPERSAAATLTMTNLGGRTWMPSAIFLSYRWFNSAGDIVTEGGRTALGKEVPSGDSVTLSLNVVPPTVPGSYTLRFDLIWEGQFWFSDEGIASLERARTVGYDLRTSPLPGTPLSTLYLPNITKQLGGRGGWVTPFIIQNVGTSDATLEINYYRFLDGALTARRVISALASGRSFASVPDNDQFLASDTQYAVVVRSFGSQAVAMVNQQLADPLQASAYRGVSEGALRIALPNFARKFNGYSTPVIIQNLGTVPAFMNAEFVSFDGKSRYTLSRTILPGRSNVIDPDTTTGLKDATQYAVTLSSDQPISAVVNSHRSGPSPLFSSYGGLAEGAPHLYAPYITHGLGEESPVVVQNLGSSVANPVLNFTPVGSADASLTVSAPPLAPGASWVFDTRFDSRTGALCAGPSSTCLGNGVYALRAAAEPGASLGAVVLPTAASSTAAYSAQSQSRSGPELYLPNITRTLGGPLGWTTPIYLQSVGASSATLEWFRFLDGALIKTQDVLLPKNAVGSGAILIDPRTVSGLSENSQYSVRIRSRDGSLNAVVLERLFAPGDGFMIYEGLFAPTP